MQKTEFTPPGAQPNGHDPAPAPQPIVQADLYQNGAVVSMRDPSGKPIATLTYHVVHPMWEGVLAQKLAELIVLKSQRVQPAGGAIPPPGAPPAN